MSVNFKTVCQYVLDKTFLCIHSITNTLSRNLFFNTVSIIPIEKFDKDPLKDQSVKNINEYITNNEKDLLFWSKDRLVKSINYLISIDKEGKNETIKGLIEKLFNIFSRKEETSIEIYPYFMIEDINFGKAFF
jgi:hypothetical protein